MTESNNLFVRCPKTGYLSRLTFLKIRIVQGDRRVITGIGIRIYPVLEHTGIIRIRVRVVILQLVGIGMCTGGAVHSRHGNTVIIRRGKINPLKYSINIITLCVLYCRLGIQSNLTYSVATRWARTRVFRHGAPVNGAKRYRKGK